VNTKAAIECAKLEQQYLDARENAVSRVRINLSLAIRMRSIVCRRSRKQGRGMIVLLSL